jgi:hypothetical protein
MTTASSHVRQPGTRCCSEPRCDHPCPLCPDKHGRCEFAAGSVHCVTAACANPHHRDRSGRAAGTMSATAR